MQAPCSRSAVRRWSHRSWRLAAGAASSPQRGPPIPGSAGPFPNRRACRARRSPEWLARAAHSALARRGPAGIRARAVPPRVASDLPRAVDGEGSSHRCSRIAHSVQTLRFSRREPGLTQFRQSAAEGDPWRRRQARVRVAFRTAHRGERRLRTVTSARGKQRAQRHGPCVRDAVLATLPQATRGRDM